MPNPTTDSLSPEIALLKALEKMEWSLRIVQARSEGDSRYRKSLERLGIVLNYVSQDLYLCRDVIRYAVLIWENSDAFREETRLSLDRFLQKPLSWYPDEEALDELSRTDESIAEDIRRCANALQVLRAAAKQLYPLGTDQPPAEDGISAETLDERPVIIDTDESSSATIPDEDLNEEFHSLEEHLYNDHTLCVDGEGTVPVEKNVPEQTDAHSPEPNHDRPRPSPTVNHRPVETGRTGNGKPSFLSFVKGLFRKSKDSSGASSLPSARPSLETGANLPPSPAADSCELFCRGNPISENALLAVDRENPSSPWHPLEDDVQFRAVAPATLERGMWFPLKVMMYEGDDWERADREAALVAEKTAQDSSSLIQLQRGREVSIQLQSADVEFEEDTQTMRWNGRFSACTFEGLVPESFAGKQVRIRGRVRQGLTVLTDLRLILKVEETPTTAPAPEETQTVPLELCSLHSAFLSYASQDRARVAACIRGILLVRPDLDIFFDVVSLRRGEHYEERIFKEIDRRDLFYLFWSIAASRSEWVGRELSFALDHLGKERVEPVPLDPPDRCPPPAALNDRHFNDWLLRYESSSNSQLTFTSGSFCLKTEDGVSIPIPEDGGILGRQELGKEVLSSDPSVSRRHAKVQVVLGSLEIMDLKSNNGTTLNGNRLEPYKFVPVEVGDKITMGRTTLTLRLR